MNIVTKPLAGLHSPAKNIRRHTEKQLKEYIRSLDKFGQIRPVVIDETGEIMIGNGLVEAMRRRGDETCACLVRGDLTANEKKKLMMADNRIYELGITDTEIFDDILRELGGDLDVPGWDTDLLETLTASLADANELVESYGTYEPEAVETVRNREHRESAPAPAASAPAEAQAVETAETGRFIVCPKCGERICL